MSDTPKTDKKREDIEYGMLSGAVHYGTAYDAMTRLARELERENARLRAAIKEAITEARTLESNTDPLVDGILAPALANAASEPRGAFPPQPDRR